MNQRLKAGFGETGCVELIFAWEGFSLEHPDDWAPVSISGGRKEGYLRLGSSGRLALQVRWKSAADAANLNQKLDNYLDRLRSDAKKAKQTFRADADAEAQGVATYKYSGSAYGRGAIFFSERAQRVFFLELTSSKNDSLLPVFRQIFSSFSAGERERWAVLGIDLTLPNVLKVERKEFLSGKTTLALKGTGVTVEAQRWGFAEELVRKHGLSSWAIAALAMPKAVVKETEGGVSLFQPGVLWTAPTYALAVLQTEWNQLATLKVTTKLAEWRPQWDWLN